MALLALNSGSSGLRAMSTSLDVIANNLANSNTDGFKSSRVNFQDLLYQERAQPGALNANFDERPTGLYVGLGVKASGTQTDFSQGPAKTTNRSLDLYIEGNGFLVVQIEDDVAEGMGYTRAGNLAINSERELVLASDTGRRIEPGIQIPEGVGEEAISISTDGIVRVLVPGQIEPAEVGQIELATFINPAGLRQIGENLYVPTAASGEPAEGEPGQDGRGLLRQGVLEGSNVDPVMEMVNLIKTQRTFELNSQSIQAADSALETVSNLRRF